MSAFPLGARVRTAPSVAYFFDVEGVVIGFCMTLAGRWRYVVEADNGDLRIFAAPEIEIVEKALDNLSDVSVIVPDSDIQSS